MTYENFYIKAPIQLLSVPLPLEAFKKKDEQGEYLDPIEFMTIPEYLATINHTVSRFSKDGKYFLKGFGFNIKGLDEMRNKFSDFNLTLDKDIWILSIEEKQEELSKPEWQSDILEP